ncbi:hypothetical protein AVEN_43819-1 [Araneus ventricosus]|uniref:Uncharacterized protein n=1 Tax=Araneus ventricosus TaxID=182803 RepID=A0A4Y2I0M7_ARAVE|nr:hypothetical protein AVEN_43819-1 [Araneus ventricosus]
MQQPPVLPAYDPSSTERPAAATHSRALWFLHISPISSCSCSNPPFYRDTTRHRKWAQRATPPLVYPSGRRQPAYLCGSFSSVNSRCPMIGHEILCKRPKSITPPCLSVRVND